MQTFFSTLPVLLLVGFGVLLRYFKILRAETIGDLKNLVVRVSLPLLLFNAFASMQFEWNYILVVLLMLAACVAVYLLAGLRPFRQAGIPQTLAAGFEAGMLGYAVYTTLFGVEHLSRFAVVDLGQVIFVFFILIPGLQAGTGLKPGWRDTLSGFIKTPVILAILLGLAGNISGFYLLLSRFQFIQTIFASMNILAGLTMPLVTLIIGYELNLNLRAMKPAIRTVAVRLAIWGLFAFLFNTFVIRSWLGLDRYFEAAVYLMVVLPAPFVVPIYSQDSDQTRKDEILNTLSLGALVALIASVVIGTIYA